MPAPTVWLDSSLKRIFPATAPQSHVTGPALEAARGERISFQVCVRNPGTAAIQVSVRVDVPDDIQCLVRVVGLVAMRHHNTDTPVEDLDGVGCIPGLVPDPLLPGSDVEIGPLETRAFWVTLTVPKGIQAGSRNVIVETMADDTALPTRTVRLEVRPVDLPGGEDFPVTHWFYADALCDWYGVAPWEDRFWEIVKGYMVDMVTHGGNSQYVPIFTPPTDGTKRPTQLLGVSEASAGRYEFDWTMVRRWVSLARKCGAEHFEWTHLFSQWGVQNALRIYRDNADANSLLWPAETPATSDIYRNFLSQFLPQFQAFLADERVLDRSLFHLSDEPSAQHIGNYKAARAMLKELAPWMKVGDALSDIEYVREGLTDIPIPSIASARQFQAEGIPAWAYFCCGPRGRYLNRLMDTPLAKIRMSGWLFHRFGALGFLHWGYNYWYRSQSRQLIDPFAEQSGVAWPGWAYGDPFVVYPGATGPIDSIRWEVWSESLQDRRLLKGLGVKPDDRILSDLHGYDDFPRTPGWALITRNSLFERWR